MSKCKIFKLDKNNLHKISGGVYSVSDYVIEGRAFITLKRNGREFFHVAYDINDFPNWKKTAVKTFLLNCYKEPEEKDIFFVFDEWLGISNYCARYKALIKDKT